MSIPYNLNIPVASNNPSVDQPNMTINTNSINTWTGIDHVVFADSGAGKHLQVSFNSNNTPAIPTSPPVLFTADDAFATPQLRFYSGNTAKTSDQYYAIAANGSTMLLGGIILKWGTGTGGTNVTFTNPFPNTIFSVVVTPNSIIGTSASVVISVSGQTVAGFTPNNSTGTPFFYVAIGN